MIRFAAIAAAAFLMATQSAFAQAEWFVTGQTVSNVINDTKDAVNEVINNADNAISSNTFQVRQHGQIFLDQLDALLKNNIGKTFEELRDSERQLLCPPTNDRRDPARRAEEQA